MVVKVKEQDNHIRKMVIARIESQETRVFPTRTKTNFSCCFQLISPEEYIMRNFYSYKEKREKFIHQQLAKIQHIEEKQHHTPASLLVQSNLSTQMKGLFTGTGKLPKNIARATDASNMKPNDTTAATITRRSAPNARSKLYISDRAVW